MMFKEISKNIMRLLSLLLVATMIISIIPMSVFAATNSDGYIEVSTIEDLYNIRNDLTANYILMNDIDLGEATSYGGTWDYDGRGWNPIGSGDVYGNNAFSGIFDGNGYSITGMRINIDTLPDGAGDKVYLGLFVNVSGTVKNLTVEGNINSVKAAYVGSIAGYVSGEISNCKSNSNISVSDSDSIKSIYAGGIAGYANKATIKNCINTGDIYAYVSAANNSYAYIGGITGYSSTTETNISNSYNMGTVRAKAASWSASLYRAFCYGAGIVYGSATIEKCYNTGAISATYTGSSSYKSCYANGIGGSVVSQSYNIGSISGYSSNYAITSGTLSNCYYLNGTGSNSAGATALTEAQMRLSSLFIGFDFNDTWTQEVNAVYPYPQLKSNPQDLRVIESMEIVSLPSKTTYAYGEELDVSGCKIKLNITNDDDEEIDVTEDMVSGYNATTPGAQTLTINYLGKSLSFTVVVNEKYYAPIYTVEDLYNVRNDLSANYILMNDIDLTEATAKGGDWDFNGNGWNPIGSGDIYGGKSFTGEFDGNGHKIIGMRIDVTTLPSGTSGTIYLGLFAKVAGTVKNLAMTGGSINYAYNYGSTSYIGSIAADCGGTTDSNAVIENCSNDMDINASSSGSNYYGNAGGIAGCGNEYSLISKCYNNGNVYVNATYKDSRPNSYASGICYNVKIEDCYNTGAIKAAAYAYGIGGTASRCYNIGTVTGGVSSYAISGTCTNCYYLSGNGNSSTGATSLTESQMKLKAMFVGFDFTNTWTLNEFANHPYPQLIDNIQDLNESASIISIISWPTKTEYMTGDELVLDGCAIDVTYVSGHKELLNVTSDMISGYDNTVAGEQTITVTYRGASDTFPVTVAERPEVIAVELISPPDETEFRIGTAFDFTGAQIKVTYNGGTTDVIDVTLDMTTGGNINHLGKQTITVLYYGKTATFDVTVTSVSISNLRLDAMPDKLTYLEGEDLDLTGMILIAEMNNGTEKEVAVGYTVSGYSDRPGIYTVTIQYMGKTVNFDVTVDSKSVIELVLRKAPTKTEYVSGQSFDPEGMIIVATFDNGDVEVVEDYTISGFDDVPGLKTVIASYGGKYVAFPITVVARVITNFEITSYPAKLDYLQYEAFDATGLKVKATYNDGVSKEITDYKVVGFSSNPGTHTISVAYEGWVETFTITVTPRSLTNLAVVAPEKLTYYLGEEFDATGLSVTACYNNGQRVLVNDYTVSGFDSNVPGTKTITIGYGGLTSAFSVLVSERSEIETNGSFTVGKVVGRLGDIIVVPVSVFNNTGIAGFTHTINFDAEDIQFVSATAVNAYENGEMIVNDENADDGEITIVWFNSADVGNSGDIYHLTFEVLEEAIDGNSEITISFDNNDNGNISGENVLFSKVNGYVDIRSYWLGDLNGDRIYGMVDLLQLAQYVSGMSMTLSDKQKLSADVNEDGEIDIHDVIMLQQWLLVSDMSSMSLFSLEAINDESTTEFEFGNVTAKTGDEVTIPVLIKNNPGLATYRFRVTYDTTALEFISAENGEIASSGSLSSTTDTEHGTMTFLWYSTTNITEDGEIALLKFRVTDEARGNYPLTVTYLAEDMVNEEYVPITYSVINGKISTGSTSAGRIRTFGLESDPVTVRLLENSAEIDAITTATGEYSFESIAPGTYTIEVSKKNHATRSYEITVGTDDISQDLELWLYGDVNGDGQVRINDYAKVLAHVRGTETLDGYSALCGDVNGDGAIRINDYAQVLAHVRGTSSLWD